MREYLRYLAFGLMHAPGQVLRSRRARRQVDADAAALLGQGNTGWKAEDKVARRRRHAVEAERRSGGMFFTDGHL